VAVKNGKVAVTNYPFWMLYKFGKIQLVDNSYTSVATSRRDDGFDVRIVHHFLETGRPYFIRAGKLVIDFKQFRVVNHLKTMLLKNRNGFFNLS